MLRAFLIVISAACLSGPLHAEVSKEFLVSLLSKFKSTLGSPITRNDFHKELTEEELAFLDKTQNYDYTDIFSGTLPKNRDVYAYNFLNFRSVPAALKERQLNAEKKCRKVFTDGVSFEEHSLHSFSRKPKEYDKKYWTFSYCTGGDLNADKESVIFYFHGVGGGPYNWVDRRATYTIRKRWRDIGRLPLWVSVSLGKVDHLAQTGKEHKFFEVIVPYIEKKIGFEQRPKRRFGFGISQGGANIVHAVMRHNNFFDAAVAVCPAVIAAPPFEGSEQHRYRVRTAASRSLLHIAISLVPREFLIPDFWYKNVDALSLGQQFLNENSTPLYIQTSSKDQLGLHEGGQLFAMLARTLGAPVMFEELEGEHCVLRPHKIADFFKSFQDDERPMGLQIAKH